MNHSTLKLRPPRGHLLHNPLVPRDQDSQLFATIGRSCSATSC
ncbi:hypothetical protein SAMN05216338_10905 [Bradyrhizobium sp. Rc2d]|nr:hypothetical protein SAMN05216338_10905 [Bradyrhizobium sp. Rc2d]